MKTQILLTVEIDDAANLREQKRILPGSVSPEVILGDVNRELRLWAGSNPYELSDPEHLSLRMAIPAGPAAPIDEGNLRVALRRDLLNMSRDLATLADTL